MSQIKTNLASGKTWSYHGGVHPPGRKSLSNQQPIQPLFIPEELIIPLRQHIGEGGRLLVQPGDYVLKGQPLTQPPHRMSLPVHASTSGTIKAVEERAIAHASGLHELCLVLQPDAKEAWCELQPIADYRQLSRHDLLEHLHAAGIAGMGGAGFPTATKLGLEKPIELLLLNAAECEPYITADDMLMREHAAEIIQGAEIIAHILNNPMVVIGIEDNKPEAAAALREAVSGTEIMVKVVPTKYPTGGEKQLIKMVTGLEVPSGGLPADIGIVVQNIASAFAIKEAVIDGKPLLQRVLTVTGKGISNPGNFWTLIGTPVDEILKQQAISPEQKTVMGGPMMGFVLTNNRIPVVKTSNCLIIPEKDELYLKPQEMPCIRCGCCAEVCPVELLPQQLGWYSKAQDEEQLRKHNLFDCIECGACAFTCSSEIPLVLYFRQAKAFIKGRELEQRKADLAKERNEAKKARVEQEKQERLAKRKAGADKTQTRAAKAAPEASSAVAAAVARAKAKKADTTQAEDISAAREARKAQARLAKQAKAEQAETTADTDPKAKVAAAIARAKAKKAAANAEAPTATAEPAPAAEAALSAEDGKKAKVAAAIARAKAKKAAASGEATAVTAEPAPAAEAALSAEDEKKAKVAAAIARAKAKKAAASGDAPTATAKPAPAALSAEDEKKAKVAAAIARAKAKKAQAEAEAKPLADSPAQDLIARAMAQQSQKGQESQSQVEPDSAKATAATTEAIAKQTPNTPLESDEDEKKRRIAAVIAKAKAKQAADKMEQTNDHDV